MAPFYEQLHEDIGLSPFDSALLTQMKQANEAKLKELDEQIADAEKNQGEMEVRDLMLKKAEYYSSIGDKVNEQWQIISDVTILVFSSRFYKEFDVISISMMIFVAVN